jgi:hypothetical protein
MKEARNLLVYKPDDGFEFDPGRFSRFDILLPYQLEPRLVGFTEEDEDLSCQFD